MACVGMALNQFWNNVRHHQHMELAGVKDIGTFVQFPAGFVALASAPNGSLAPK